MKTKSLILIFPLMLLLFSACQKEELKEVTNEISNAPIGLERTSEDLNPDNNPCDVDQLDLRILFIGNSYTDNYTTDIPKMFKELADENSQYVDVVSTSAILGYTLQNHLSYSGTLNLVNQGNWDYVILQENSGALANGGTNAFTAGVASFVSLIANNSPNAKIILYQMVPPVIHTSFNFAILQNNWNNLFTNTANNYSNVFVCNIGQAFKNAYDGDFSYSVTSPDELRYGSQYGFHFDNPGGFLAAVTFYAAIFNNKPCLPTNMTFYTGGQTSLPIANVVTQYHSLAQIGYVEGQYSIFRFTPITCKTPGYKVRSYPCGP